MYVWFISGVANEVMELKRCTRVPPVLTILSSVSSGPVVTSVPISRCVLVVHIEPQALHGVSVQDVGEAEGVAELRGVGEVGAVVPALGLVHHQGVGAHIGPASTLSAPVCGGRLGGQVRDRLRH